MRDDSSRISRSLTIGRRPKAGPAARRRRWAAGGRSSYHVHCFPLRACFSESGPCPMPGRRKASTWMRALPSPANGGEAWPSGGRWCVSRAADVGCGVISHSSLRHPLQVQSARLGRWPQAGGPHLTASPPLLVWVATLRCGDRFPACLDLVLSQHGHQFSFLGWTTPPTGPRRRAARWDAHTHARPRSAAAGGPSERRAGRSQRKPPRRLVRQIETCDRR